MTSTYIKRFDRPGSMSRSDRPSTTFNRRLRRLPANDPLPSLPQLARGSRWLGALTKVGRIAFRANPYLLAGVALYDLYDYWQQQAIDTAGWSIPADFECGNTERFIRRGTFTEAQCGTDNYMSPAAWNNYGNYPVIVAGQLYGIHWYGWEYDSTWLGNIFGIRTSHFHQVIDPPVPEADLVNYPDPEWVTVSQPAIFGSPARAPLRETLDPMEQPIGLPRGTPTPVPYKLQPYRQHNPYRSPIEQSHRGNFVPGTPRLRPDEVPLLFPAITVGSTTSSNAAPISSVSLAHSGSHQLRPPEDRKTKERKVRVAGAGQVINVVNNVTEVIDLIEVLYDAIPENHKVRYNGTRYVKRDVSVPEMLEVIYKNWGQLDVPEALAGFISNEIEDRLYGAIGRVGGKISERLGSQYGMGINTATRLAAKEAMRYRFTQPKE